MANTKYLELPVGLDEPGGVVKRTIEIKKLKGTLQRDLAKLQQQKKPDPAVVIDTILMPAIVTLDGAPPTLGKIRQMPMADRDWLLFELRKFTWGNTVTATDTCETCNPPTKMTYPDMDLDKLPTTRLEDDAAWWDGKQVVPGDVAKNLSGADKQALAYRVLLIENPDMGVRGVFRVPNGKDQSALAHYADRQVDALWKLMSMTCLQWSDPEHASPKIDPKKGLPEDFWADLDADVLGWSQVAFKDAQPGIDTVIDLECDVGHPKKTRLVAQDFFFPEATQSS